jgi:hypothetical protein
MRRFRIIAFASAILATAGTAGADVSVPDVLHLLGNVTNAARPVANALVIALNLNSLEANQTFTAPDGTFRLPLLRNGVYKVIAVKYGLAPASAMVLPGTRDRRVALRMQSEKRGGKDANQEIWEIRGSLPPDVLHELDVVMAPPLEIAVNPIQQVPRLRAQMVSMTGVAAQQSDAAFAQTTLGVQSRINQDWQLGFHGNIHRIDNPTDEARFGAPVAETSVMQMELRSSETDAYRVASTKTWWRYSPSTPAAQRQADVRSHNFEWDHGDARVQVRYFQQENLFMANPGSQLFEVAGNTTVLQTARSGIGVSLRVAQENVHNSTNAIFRTADLTTMANLDVVPSLTVRYGMTSRLGVYGTEWAPRTGAEWKVGKDTSLVVSGMYKVYDQSRGVMMPSVVVWSDESSVMPRYSYSFGIVSRDGKKELLSAIATVSAADSPLRVIFTDSFEQFWDGLYVDTGDVRRDIRLAYRKELGSNFLLDISSSAGVATPPPTAVVRGEKVYVTGDVASTFHPTGTTLAVSFRQLHQPQPTGGTSEYRMDRMNVRIAQSLHLPFDLRVLMGMEVAHASNSPFLFDTLNTDGSSRKYIGGLAMNF